MMSGPFDPPRLLDDASAGSDHLRLLVRSAGHDGPGRDQLDELGARLGPLLAGLAPATVAPPAALVGKASVVSSLLAAKSKVVAIGAALVVSSSGALYVHNHTARPVASGVPAASEPPSAAIAAPAVAGDQPPPADAATDVPPPATAPTARQEKSEASAVDPGADRDLVQRAQAALVQGNAATALSLTDEHRARFGRSPRSEERERIAIEALVRLGRGGEARRRATRFLTAYPRSVFGPRVRSLTHQEGGP